MESNWFKLISSLIREGHGWNIKRKPLQSSKIYSTQILFMEMQFVFNKNSLVTLHEQFRKQDTTDLLIS